MLTGKAVAQSVTVDATIDSLQIYIGDQAKIKLQVALDADKRAIFPVYTDTLVSGVEIIDVAKPDTQYINDDKRMLITQEYTVTSFDSALYYLPPMEVLVDNKAYRSKALALKVYSMNVPLIQRIRTVFWSEDSNATSFCVGRLVWDYHLWHIAYSDCIITYLSDHAYL